MSKHNLGHNTDNRPILLTIDDPEVDALVAELMALTGETEEQVVFKALQDKRERLMARREPPA